MKTLAHALLLLSLVWAGTPAAPQAQAYDTVLERVIPRQCILSVAVDPSKCVFKGYILTPETECRGPIGGQLTCTNLSVQLDSCKPTITRRTDCEMTNVKKVLRNEPLK